MPKASSIRIPKDIQRRSLISLLKKNQNVTLKFLKKDGTVTERRCTLHPDTIPQVDGDIGGENKENVIVYDQDKSGFRTIILANFRGGSYTPTPTGSRS